ncbi:MAG: RNA methyltransferase [Peptococcaceae bacterium BRH_c4b]|nr:MAG: RNA methyltransferase [Peptococcaceae bacterium BRH_c4b]
MFAGGQEIELYIDNLNHSGEGVGRWQGMAVFVPLTLPGERVRVRIDAVKKNYARAGLLDILEPVTGRSVPGCAKFGNCGGCSLQHMDYAGQLSAKQELVRQSLSRIGGLGDVPVMPVLGMANPWHYRNKVHLQVEEKNGRLVLGFYEEGSHRLAETVSDMSQPVSADCCCLLVDRDLNDIAYKIQEILNSYGLKAWNRDTGQGLMRHVLLRKAAGTGQMMAVLVTGPGEWPDGERFASELAGASHGVASVLRHINTTPGSRVLGGSTFLLHGRTYIQDSLGGLVFNLSAESFYQVNPSQTQVLYQKALDYAGLTGSETVVDAYSGVGTIALFLARRAGRVAGLELVPEAVEDARVNAELNSIHNVEFHQGAVEKLLPRLVRRGLKPDVVVLDPPRRGCHIQVLETIGETQVPRVIYVSCDPASLARDLRRLVDCGYKVEEVQPVDMFPQTSHVECVVRIDRK